MLLLNQIETSFNFLELERGFAKNIEQKNNIIIDLNYLKENVNIHITIEEMEERFYMEVLVGFRHNNYSIGENPYYINFNNNILEQNTGFKSIFDFTENRINENEFKRKTEELYRKIKWVFFGKNAMKEIIQLYKTLLVAALDNIIIWSQREDESL